MFFLFYGRKKDGEFVFASENVMNEEVFCPDCMCPLHVKKSKRGRYFFVHYQKCRKDYGEGSQHYFWKMYILKQLQKYEARPEITLDNCRRADIFFNKTAIELQFSTIRSEDLKDRVNDYSKLKIEQYWIFKLPEKTQLLLKLSPMEMYIWQETDLPLLYLDTKNKQLIHIVSLQFIQRNKAYFHCERVSWKNIIHIRRYRNVDFQTCKLLQQKWKHERQRQIIKFNNNYHYQTQLARRLYYLRAYGYTLEDFGKVYTGNVYFVISPFVWQIQTLYLYKIKKKTISECAVALEKVSVIHKLNLLEQIVEQLLLQFSVKPEEG